MNCQKYREWIEDAALGELDDRRRVQLQEHLDACPDCRSAFAAAQTLFAAIDRGVAARVESRPPADFAARVRMSLAAGSERAQRRWWRPAPWIPALAGAALALFLIFSLNSRHRARRMPPPKPQIARTAAPAPASPGNLKRPEQASISRPPAVLPAAVIGRPSSGTSAAALPATAPAARRGAACCAPDSRAPQLQVQIQPGQWAAVESLYRAGQAGRVDETDKPVPADQPLQVQPVDVAPLAVAELQDPKPVGTDER
jgi:hypothetical protein